MLYSSDNLIEFNYKKSRKSWTILSKQTYHVTPVGLKTPGGVRIETASRTVNSCIQTHYLVVFLLLVFLVTICVLVVVVNLFLLFLAGTIIHLVDCLYDSLMDEESASAAISAAATAAEAATATKESSSAAKATAATAAEATTAAEAAEAAEAAPCHCALFWYCICHRR